MLVYTSENVSGMQIVESLGLVRGNTIRARHVGRDILAGLKMLFGGEITDYTKMMAESREQALDRMCEEAQQLGADAVVAARFTTSTIAQGSAELLAYGTAVKLAAR
jgi:uncharacterized protein YbjQ (UPF0145 family)